MMENKFILIVLCFLLAFSLVSSLIIIRAKSPLYSIIFLLVLFILTSFVLLLTGNEFLALLYIIVYIGAVIVLLLWVIMTVPIKPFYSVPVTLVTSFIAFAMFLVLSIVAIFFISEYPNIVVFKVSPSSELFPVFLKVIVKYVPATNYINFINSLTIVDVNGIDTSSVSKLCLSQKGEFLFLKLFSNIYTQHQLANLYFPAPFLFDSVLWTELFQAYSTQFNDFFIPEFLRKVTLFYRLSDLINSSSVTISYRDFLLNTLSLKLLPISFDWYTYCCYKSLSLPIHLFGDIAGMAITPQSVIKFEPRSFIDWFNFISLFHPNLITSMALALYTYYGVTLLIVAMLLLVAMIGVILIVKSTEILPGIGFIKQHSNGNNKSNYS